MKSTATTFYFSKFPENWNARALWKMFEKYGSLVDVYVATKRTKGGDRFGFARFKNVTDVQSFEHSLSGILIGSSWIQVNVARYNKCYPQQRPDPGIKVAEAFSFAHKNGACNAGRSYREAVTGSSSTRNIQHDDKNSVEVSVQIKQEKFDWLNKCVIGEVKDIEILANLGSLFVAEGWDWEEFELKYIGGLSIIIECPSSDAIKLILENQSCWIHHYVSNIKPWSENFESPGLLEVEDMQKGNALLHSISVLVLTKSMADLSRSLPVLINNRRFVLHVQEDWNRTVVGEFCEQQDEDCGEEFAGECNNEAPIVDLDGDDGNSESNDFVPESQFVSGVGCEKTTLADKNGYGTPKVADKDGYETSKKNPFGSPLNLNSKACPASPIPEAKYGC
ncbi:nucleotide-binding alpha-beta plait domain-containing protein [Tanacetum coccineum]